MSFAKDFEFVAGFADAFFRQSRIRRSIEAFHKLGITKWESWLQVEMGLFFETCPQIAEWDMEVPFALDQRQAISRGRQRKHVDLTVRQKGCARERWILLELKQHNEMGRCVSSMLEDAQRIFAMRNRSHHGDQQRSFMNLGVFEAGSRPEIETHIRNAYEGADIAVDRLWVRKVTSRHHAVIV